MRRSSAIAQCLKGAAFTARWARPSRLAGLRPLVSDRLEHEAVQVQEECCVEALVVLGKGLGLVEYLVAASPRPLVNKVYVTTRWNMERNMLQSNLMP